MTEADAHLEWPTLDDSDKERFKEEARDMRMKNDFPQHVEEKPLRKLPQINFFCLSYYVFLSRLYEYTGVEKSQCRLRQLGGGGPRKAGGLLRSYF